MNGEIVMINVFDIGRHVDLDGILSSGTISSNKAHPRIDPARAGASFGITMPVPIYFELDEVIREFNLPAGKTLRLEVKIYEDGVISISARLHFQDIALTSLHEIRGITFSHGGNQFNLKSWVTFQFDAIMSRIARFVDKGTDLIETSITEHYSVYCIWDDVGDPAKFVDANKNI